MQKIEEVAVKENIGWAIKRSRVEKGKSQEELSKEARISRTFLNLVENGRRTPSYSTLEDIAKSLGENPAGLIAKARLGESDPENRLRYLLEKLLRSNDEERLGKLLNFVNTLR